MDEVRAGDAARPVEPAARRCGRSSTEYVARTAAQRDRHAAVPGNGDRNRPRTGPTRPTGCCRGSSRAGYARPDERGVPWTWNALSTAIGRCLRMFRAVPGAERRFFDKTPPTTTRVLEGGGRGHAIESSCRTTTPPTRTSGRRPSWNGAWVAAAVIQFTVPLGLGSERPYPQLRVDLVLHGAGERGGPDADRRQRGPAVQLHGAGRTWCCQVARRTTKPGRPTS